MTASRQLYWNIHGHGFMYLLFLVALVIFGYGIYRQYKLWRRGLPENRTDDIPTRIYNVLVHTFSHRRILREGYAGSMHGMIFYGFILFVLGTTVVALQADFGLEIYHGSLYLWLSLLLDLGGLAAIVGILLAYYRRYVLKPDRLDNKPDDGYSLHLLLLIIVTGFILEGFRITATQDPWAAWSPVGMVIGKVFGVMSAGALSGAHVFFWWLHLLLAFGFIAYLPYSKLLHIVTTPLNQFFSTLRPKGALAGIDFENEDLENYGVSQLEHFTWKQLFDTAACTRCGRCQDNCPAYLTKKPLSPKEMTQDLKAYLEDCGSAKQSIGTGEEVTAETAAAEEKSLVGDVFSEDTIWSCTTCRACQEQCPSLVEHIDKTIGMRRHLVLEESNFPAEVQTVFRNLENNSNPWGVGFAERAKWAEGLDVKILEEDSDVDILYWPGCAGAFDDRNKKVAAAVVKVLQAAGINFGILGTEEKCCGDSARRIGNEYLFQMTAEENIETIKSYGIKKIVTHCPHCFNTLKNEYPEFGADFEVVHHTQYIRELIDTGALPLCKSTDLEVTYHDSCYLGRYNDEYQAPRQVIDRLGGTIKEMEKNNNQSFCCGAGGGRMWMEETLGSRINEERTKQAVATGAGTVVTNCPFCLTMIEDGLKNYEDTEMNTFDIAELVEKALH
ncbi:4Fe-4S dicluster domain-containing protein [Metallumcola ferriviriculae]|uniref:4Fe-4S dicluster domain-containing protein n=1 Tax=Metallumcola ferriviriculae TaxID=3039180 RepID=A0AAU0UN62_9FIRM|nr:4Fe-4S dicluster domain-containing protein [Desulfitibacteraceae bacterium MK1]